jgi:chromate transporter
MTLPHDPGAEPAPEPGRAQPTIGFGRFLRYFLWLGTFGFGGPIATVGYMQRDLVEGRGWVNEQDFLNGVALGQTMPGPLAAQVAMWVGFLQRGAAGALLVALPFILPSFFVVLTVAIFYVSYQGLDWVQGLFYGIAPGVMAIIAIAAVKLARLTDRKEPRLWAISAITMLVTALTQSEIALLFIAAGLVMVLWEAPARFSRRPPVALFVPSPMLAQGVVLAGVTSETYVALTLFFLKAGAFIFGSGLAIVPFLREGVVEQHHWLTERQFTDAVAMGLISPGPVVIMATFAGYLVYGVAGALIATIFVFLPALLLVVIPGPLIRRHEQHPRLRGFIKGATAAAAGAIAGAAIVIAGDILHSASSLLIALVALVLLLQGRLKVPEPALVAGAALVGIIAFG